MLSQIFLIYLYLLIFFWHFLLWDIWLATISFQIARAQKIAKLCSKPIHHSSLPLQNQNKETDTLLHQSPLNKIGALACSSYIVDYFKKTLLVWGLLLLLFICLVWHGSKYHCVSVVRGCQNSNLKKHSLVSFSVNYFALDLSRHSVLICENGVLPRFCHEE